MTIVRIKSLQAYNLYYSGMQTNEEVYWYAQKAEDEEVGYPYTGLIGYNYTTGKTRRYDFTAPYICRVSSGEHNSHFILYVSYDDLSHHIDIHKWSSRTRQSQRLVHLPAAEVLISNEDDHWQHDQPFASWSEEQRERWIGRIMCNIHLYPIDDHHALIQFQQSSSSIHNRWIKEQWYVLDCESGELHSFLPDALLLPGKLDTMNIWQTRQGSYVVLKTGQFDTLEKERYREQQIQSPEELHFSLDEQLIVIPVPDWLTQLKQGSSQLEKYIMASYDRDTSLVNYCWNQDTLVCNEYHLAAKQTRFRFFHQPFADQSVPPNPWEVTDQVMDHRRYRCWLDRDQLECRYMPDAHYEKDYRKEWIVYSVFSDEKWTYPAEAGRSAYPLFTEKGFLYSIRYIPDLRHAVYGYKQGIPDEQFYGETRLVMWDHENKILFMID